MLKVCLLAGASMGLAARCTPAARSLSAPDATPVIGSASVVKPHFSDNYTSTPQANPTATTPLNPTATHAADRNAGTRFANHGTRDELTVAITVDDFTYPRIVVEKLNPLLKANATVKLTLFPIGDRISVVEKAVPGFWRSMLDQGHEIGFHSMHHDDLGKKTTAQLLDEVDRFNREVASATALPFFLARYGRPPFGNYGDWTQFINVANQLDMTWVLWSTVPSSADTMSLDLPEAITPGDIALFHIRWQDMGRLTPYVEECRKRNLRFVTLSEMLLTPSG